MSPVIKKKDPPQPHQEEACQKVLAALNKNKPKMFDRSEVRTQCIMACGTGKTFVSLMVAERGQYKKIVIFVPSLALVRQVLAEYRARASWKRWAAVAVCSDANVSDDESFYVSPQEVGCEVTTDTDAVESFLDGEGVRVVFCTYQSSHLLRSMTFDLGVFDEAHRTAGAKTKAFAYALSNKNVSITHRLFMTATPKHAKAVGDGTQVPVFSMDNEKAYGKVAYRLSFREAIDKGLICDYKIAINVLLEDVATDNKRAAQVAISKAMKERDVKRAFTFHSSIYRAHDFTLDAGEIPERKLHINGKMSTDERENKFAEMRRWGGIITNVRCLAEGVDLPAVDMVGFIDPKRSMIDIVQAIGRCLRNSEGKKEGVVFVPVYVPKDKSLEEILASSEFGHVFDIIQAMREQDELIAEFLVREKLNPPPGPPKGPKGPLSPIEDKNEEEVSIVDGPLRPLPDIVPPPSRTPPSRTPPIEINVDIGTNTPFVSIEMLRRAIMTRIVDATSGLNSADVNKKLLLEMARRGDERPTRRTKLGSALCNYTNQSSDTYDPIFDKQIRKFAPHWFINTADVNKKLLLEMAKRGDKRPKQGTKLSTALGNYTHKSSRNYDPVFDKQIRKLAPQWFKCINTADVNKKLLLEMAQRGEKKPLTKTNLGKALSRYTHKSSRNYDPVFDKQIRKFAPQWFINTADANKKLLLEMAQRGKKKPKYNTKLGMALRNYTGQSSESYDPIFDKQIRKLAPHWFKK